MHSGGRERRRPAGPRIAAMVAVPALLSAACVHLYPDGLISRSTDFPIPFTGVASFNWLDKEKNQALYSAGPFGTVKALRTNPTVMPDDSTNPRLAKILQHVAVKKEIIVAVANSNVKETLGMWFTNIKRVGITNYLVVALDDSIENFCKSKDVPVYRRDPDEGIDSIGKHETMPLCSEVCILREFLQLGYSVLLSDIDIMFFQNPFDHLYRDSDIESMSDGHDNMTAYGTVFPSHPGYEGLHASKRTMDIYLFMNSKVLFKTVRKSAQLGS
ncbi:hypothetical protein ZWY2020_031077 [Hordeum vulgare]|nr:hypothetical protein ZWY2020_031077 [Hordeum vulgare]